MVWLKRDTLRRTPHPPPGKQLHPAAPAGAAPPAAPALSEVLPGDSPDPLSRLRKLLDEGHFPPGSRLPPERALAVDLGVGRPALREAIKALCAIRVLESRHGSGTYVRAREASPAHPGPPADCGQFGILDLLEARKILEPRAAWLAATRAGEQQLREIEAARRQLEIHAGDWHLVAKLDAELHSAILRGVRNPVMEMLGRLIVSQTFENRSLTRFAPDVARMRREHNTIVAAILKRQPDAAAEAMMEHLNSAGLDFIAEAGR